MIQLIKELRISSGVRVSIQFLPTLRENHFWRLRNRLCQHTAHSQQIEMNDEIKINKRNDIDSSNLYLCGNDHKE
jgi:hypothetical protein